MQSGSFCQAGLASPVLEHPPPESLQTTSLYLRLSLGVVKDGAANRDNALEGCRVVEAEAAVARAGKVRHAFAVVIRLEAPLPS